MQKLYPYLTFNGNCREAMSFYKSCLGGELIFQTVGDVPGSEDIPQEMRHFILQATLIKDGMVLVATDMVTGEGLTKGNAISVYLESQSYVDIRHCYQSLRKGGEAIHPLQKTHWGGWFGELKDKFGIHWLMHCQK